MAKTKKVSGTRVVGAGLGGGLVPGMASVQAYKYGKAAGKSTGKSMAYGAGALGVTTALAPVGLGSAAGAYIGASRSMQKQMGHKAYIARGKAKNGSPRMNNDITKATARSKVSSSANTKNMPMHTRTKGRVGKK